jgi:hypothetical protein
MVGLGQPGKWYDAHCPIHGRSPFQRGECLFCQRNEHISQLNRLLEDQRSLRQQISYLQDRLRDRVRENGEATTARPMVPLRQQPISKSEDQVTASRPPDLPTASVTPPAPYVPQVAESYMGVRDIPTGHNVPEIFIDNYKEDKRGKDPKNYSGGDKFDWRNG